MSSRQYDIEKPSENTCTWLLQHPLHQTWQREGGLLWISGKPGAGKSTLMEFARHNASEDTDNGHKLVLSFYFHGRGTDLQKSTDGLLRSLLHQLLMKSRSVRTNFESLFKSKQMIQGQPGPDWVWHARELQELLDVAFAEVIQLRPIKIFIDALDECGEETASKLVSYFEKPTSRMTAKGSWHLCFSCRRYPVLNITGGSEICVEEENSSDISAHIWTALESCSEIRPQLAPEIARKASGVFLWVSLVLPLITRLHNGGMSISVISSRIQDVPRDLMTLYRQTISDIDPQERSRALYLFQWICFCERPLTVKEQRDALNFHDWAIIGDLGGNKTSQQPLDLDEGSQRTIQAIIFLSAGLAEVRELCSDDYMPRHIVQLVHQSVKDFMMKEGLELLAPKPSFTVIGSAQDRLAQSCMAYALATQAQHPNFVVPDFWEERKWYEWGYDQGNTFYKYAIQFSLVHAEQAEKYGVMQKDILKSLGPTSHEPDDISRNKKAYLKAISKQYFLEGPVEWYPPIIHIMAQFNILSLVRSMVETTTDINERDRHGMTALHRCAESGSLKAVRFLLQNGADDTYRDNFGKTPLHRACFRSREHIVEILSGNAKSQNARDANGLTPLHDAILAVLQGDSKICWAPTETSTALVQYDVNAEGEGISVPSTIDTRAIRNEGKELLETISILLRTGSKFDARDTFGRTPLHLAVSRQLEAVTCHLLAIRGIDVNAADATGHTPILTAAQQGAFESVKLLCEQADVNLSHQTDDGRTLLSYVVEYKVYNIEAFISSLIARKEVNPDGADKLGRTPLSYAYSQGSIKTIQVLLACDSVDPCFRDVSGRTPLSYLCSRGSWGHERYKEIFEFLISRSESDLESKDQAGRSLLSHAAEAGNHAALEGLMNRDSALCLSRDATGKTPTRWAYIGRCVGTGIWL